MDVPKPAVVPVPITNSCLNVEVSFDLVAELPQIEFGGFKVDPSKIAYLE